jgi:Icc-related predicted phosphoesterase
MVKILAIGDFHGKFPSKLKKEAKKVDLIIALGDYANADKIRKLIFKNWTNKKWYEAIGIRKARQLEKESFDSGLKVIKELNALGKSVYIIWGNTDFYKEYATSEPPIIMPGFYNENIKTLKNINLFNRKKISINNIDLIGHGGYVDVTEFIRHPLDKNLKNQKKRLKRYKRDEGKLKRLFKKYKHINNFILGIHYAPLNIFDKVIYPGSPMNGKHVGWQPYNDVIAKYKPKLVLCGHMHEYQGKKKFGKSLVVNPGAAFQGKAAIIDWPSLKVRFIK